VMVFNAFAQLYTLCQHHGLGRLSTRTWDISGWLKEFEKDGGTLPEDMFLLTSLQRNGIFFFFFILVGQIFFFLSLSLASLGWIHIARVLVAKCIEAVAAPEIGL
jgi:hypothetical protein